MFSYQQLERKVLNLIKRGLITLEKAKAQFGQCSFQETVSNYEAVTPYGIANKTPQGCLVVLMNVGADPSNKVGFEYDNKTYYEVEIGEVAIYHPLKKSYIHFKNDGSIFLKSMKDVNIDIEGDANINVKGTTNLTCPQTNIEGDVDITGDVNVTGKIDATAKITSQTDCVAGTISLTGHKHSGTPLLVDAVPSRVTGDTQTPS